jgi:hypothetical protein
LRYKVLGGSKPYACVVNAFEYAGFKIVDEEDEGETQDCNAIWGVSY